MQFNLLKFEFLEQVVHHKFEPNSAYVDHTEQATMFFLALSNARHFSKLVIDKCPSNSAAVQMITKKWFLRKVSEQKVKKFVIILKVDENFDSLNSEELEELTKGFFNRDIIITFDFSSEEDSKYQIYWKSSNMQSFLKLDLSDIRELKIKQFITNFIMKSMNENCLGNKTFCCYQFHFIILFPRLISSGVKRTHDLVRDQFIFTC